MKSIHTLAATVAAISLLFGSASQAAGDAAAGKTKSAACAACHGADGNSTNPEWPKLAGQHAQYIARQLADFKDGKTRSNALMAPMVAGLSEQDMADLGAYFESQASSGFFISEEQKAAGEKVYRGGNKDTQLPACSGCHGPAGKGDGRAGFPSLAGQHPAYIASQLNAFRNGTRSNDRARMMRDIALRITPDEIKAVSEYVSALK
ncbi:MAG: cytochrome c4 [Gammaproteobacteria bacterium]|nr:cytochrome c4 [Gammaproteobacteria bacterium]